MAKTIKTKKNVEKSLFEQVIDILDRDNPGLFDYYDAETDGAWCGRALAESFGGDLFEYTVHMNNAKSWEDGSPRGLGCLAVVAVEKRTGKVLVLDRYEAMALVKRAA